jgi:hypothetical protein
MTYPPLATVAAGSGDEPLLEGDYRLIELRKD